MRQLPESLSDGRVLLRERYDFSRELDASGAPRNSLRFTESKVRGTLGKIEGTAAKVDIINKNDRFYSKAVYELACSRAMPLLSDNVFLGEVDHPWLGGSLQAAAVRFENVYLDGEFMKFEGVILDTSPGKELKALIGGGVGVQVSTRGYGSSIDQTMLVNGVEKEVSVIQTDYEMEGIDFVLFGSNPAGKVEDDATRGRKPAHKETVHMTKDELKASHPELLTSIETAARVGYADAASTEAHCATVIAAAMQESKAALASTLKGFLPESLFVAPADALVAATTENTSLKASVVSLTTELATVKAALAVFEAAKETAVAAESVAAAKTAVKAKCDEVLGTEALKPYAEVLRADLEACATVEAVEAMVASRRTVIEAIATRAAVVTGGKGSGKAEGTESDTVEYTEAQKQDRKLAGIVD